MDLERFNVVEHLPDQKSIVLYLAEVLKEGTPAAFVTALGHALEAIGRLEKIPVPVRFSRAFRVGGHPRFATVSEALARLGLKLSVTVGRKGTLRKSAKISG